MDPAFENTCEQNHREELSELASAHWQPVKDSSLVVKIAPGCGGVGEGAGWKRRRACWLVWAPLAYEGKPQEHPPPPSCFCFATVCWGVGGRPSITGHKVLPVSQGPLPMARMWGGWVNE